MNNMMQKMTLLIIVILTLLSCTAKEDPSGLTNVIERNHIELNIQNNHGENETSDAEPLSPAEPASQQTVQPESDNFFLSGRTELMSLYSQGNITAEGFAIGDLYVSKTSSAAEREIVETCRMFFQSLGKEEMTLYVDPSRQREISDYYNYFFYNKIQIEKTLFGKPKIGSKDAVVEIIFFPEAILVYLYLSNKDSSWLISGMEADLGNESRKIVIDKWAPSMSPLSGGY